MINSRTRKTITAKMDLINAVGKVLKKYGFSRLGVNLVADEAKMDKTAIYRYFKGFDELLKAYIEKQEYWLLSLKEYGDTIVEDKKEFLKKIVKEQFEMMYSNKEFQQLIVWELADKENIAAPLTIKREIYSKGLLSQSRALLDNCGINFNFILALILGGMYYVIIHKEQAPFCEVDLTQKEQKEEFIKTLDWLIDTLFAANETASKIETIAIKAHKKGMNIEDISEITGLSINKIRELIT